MTIQVTVPCFDGHALARLQTVLIEMRMPFSVDPSDHGDEPEVDEDGFEPTPEMVLAILRGAQAHAMHPEAARQLNELVFALQAPEPATRRERLAHPQATQDNRPSLPFRRPTANGNTHSDVTAKHEVRNLVPCPKCGAEVGAWCFSKSTPSWGVGMMHADRIDLINWD